MGANKATGGSFLCCEGFQSENIAVKVESTDRTGGRGGRGKPLGGGDSLDGGRTSNDLFIALFIHSLSKYVLSNYVSGIGLEMNANQSWVSGSSSWGGRELHCTDN